MVRVAVEEEGKSKIEWVQDLQDYVIGNVNSRKRALTEPKLVDDKSMLSGNIGGKQPARVPTWHDLLLCSETDRGPNRMKVRTRRGEKESSVWNKYSATETLVPVEAARLNHAGIPRDYGAEGRSSWIPASRDISPSSTGSFGIWSGTRFTATV
jgi:hypothetical protein